MASGLVTSLGVHFGSTIVLIDGYVLAPVNQFTRKLAMAIRVMKEAFSLILNPLTPRPNPSVCTFPDKIILCFSG